MFFVGKRQPGAERRGVLLGHTVGKDDFAGDAVGVEDLDAPVVVPRAA